MKKPSVFCLALFLLGACSLSARAQFLNFDFSFIDSGEPYAGPFQQNNSLGETQGEIFGLQNNTTSVPSDIIVTSSPLPGATYPISFYTYEGITVSDGVITGMQIAAVTSDTRWQLFLNAPSFFTSAPEIIVNINELDYNGSPLSGPDDGSISLQTFNTVADFTDPATPRGLTLTLVNPIPEPSYYGFGIFIATAWVVGWRRGKRAGKTGTDTNGTKIRRF